MKYPKTNEFYENFYKQALNYYSKHAPLLPPDSGHRQYRIRLFDMNTGTIRFKKIRRRLRRPLQLQRLLLRLLQQRQLPLDVYVTVSKWLSPERLSSKKLTKQGYKHLSMCLLSSDFFIDVDEDNYDKIKKCHDLLKDKGYTFKVARTGRGYHLWVLNWYDKVCTKEIPRIKDRIDYVKQKKKGTLAYLKLNGAEIDEAQSINVFQIARVWNTLHPNGKPVGTFSL